MLPLHQSPVARSAGFEPATCRVEAGCVDPLSYERLARQVVFEPTTSGSEARRTRPLCYWRLERGALSELLERRGVRDRELQPGDLPYSVVTCASGAGVWRVGGADGVDSNPRPLAYKASALPTELRRRLSFGFVSWLAAILALALAGCAAQTVTVPREVKVEVPVACVQERPQRPALRSEAELLALDRYRRTLAAWSDLKAYEAWAAELEAVVEGCSRIPAR